MCKPIKTKDKPSKQPLVNADARSNMRLRGCERSKWLEYRSSGANEGYRRRYSAMCFFTLINVCKRRELCLIAPRSMKGKGVRKPLIREPNHEWQLLEEYASTVSVTAFDEMESRTRVSASVKKSPHKNSKEQASGMTSTC